MAVGHSALPFPVRAALALAASALIGTWISTLLIYSTALLNGADPAAISYLVSGVWLGLIVAIPYVVAIGLPGWLLLHELKFRGKIAAMMWGALVGLPVFGLLGRELGLALVGHFDAGPAIEELSGAIAGLMLSVIGGAIGRLAWSIARPDREPLKAGR